MQKDNEKDVLLSNELRCLRILQGRGGRVGIGLFVLPCNTVTVMQKNHAPVLEIITPTMDACSRMFFESPFFFCRKYLKEDWQS